MGKHGRAVMPFGKHKGVGVKHIPDSYLSWLMGSGILNDPKWDWLKESVEKEFRARDLHVNDEPDEPQAKPPAVTQTPLNFEADRPRRMYRLKEDR